MLQQLSAFTFTFASLVEKAPDTGVVLRHDVDKRPQQSLAFARLQHDSGVRGTYYFRIVKESFEPRIMEEIASLGPEIGCHYEDLSLVAKEMKKGGRRRGNGSRQAGDENDQSAKS